MKKTLWILGSLLTLLLLLGGLFTFFELRSFAGATRATSTGSISTENSYLFASPLRARANAQEKIRLTVFILNGQGLGVQGKVVTVSSNPNLKIDLIQPTTDQFGKAVFDIASTLVGEYYLQVQVEGQNLSQKAHLTYY